MIIFKNVITTPHNTTKSVAGAVLYISYSICRYREVSMKQLSDQLTDNRKYMEIQFQQLSNTLNQLADRITNLTTKQSGIEHSMNFYGEELKDLKLKTKEIDGLKEQIERQHKCKPQNNCFDSCKVNNFV